MDLPSLNLDVEAVRRTVGGVVLSYRCAYVVESKDARVDTVGNIHRNEPTSSHREAVQVGSWQAKTKRRALAFGVVAACMTRIVDDPRLGSS